MTFLENIDKANLKKILLVVISVLTLAALALLLVIIVMSIEPKTPVKNDFELKDYTVSVEDVQLGTLIVADKDHSYSVDRALLDLVDCQGYRDEMMKKENVSEKNYLPYKGMMLNKTAMENAHKLLTDLRSGVTGAKPVTIDAAFDRIVYGGKDTEGYKTGMLIFLSDNSSDSGSYAPLGDDCRSWLNSNAAKYGFVNDFEDAYRYVGNVHASYMTTKKLSVASYVEYLKENTNADKALTVKVGGEEYIVYFVPCEAGDVIKVPADMGYTVSGTNNGGVVITAKVSK
jgi:hypothetical protein